MRMSAARRFRRTCGSRLAYSQLSFFFLLWLVCVGLSTIGSQLSAESSSRARSSQTDSSKADALLAAAQNNVAAGKSAAALTNLSHLLDLLKNDIRLKRVDRKSTRLNSSHTVTSYAVFCLKN